MLMNLDLKGNPVSEVVGYTKKVYEMFPALEVPTTYIDVSLVLGRL